ncbi:MAG: O-acetyl-ADP-ribose deacetylase [Chromatiales bacterium]|nr:MAG: O-acetyl-ADP-ribose deacetylase [Chromatiales bacterium]
MAGFDRIELIVADITTLDVDVVVNAANSALAGGGGVDGAIHRAAGPRLGTACRALGGCPTGESRLTPGFDLNARWIVHTVGPVWQGGLGGEAELLAACYLSAIRLAAAQRARSVAFPAISCGVYGYPVDRAAEVALATVSAALEELPRMERVLHVCHGVGVFAAYQRALSGLKESP